MTTNSVIRQLTEAEFDRYGRIMANAYPGMRINTDEDLARLRERFFVKRRQDPRISDWGLFRNDEMLGAMRLLDYTLQYRGVAVPAGGVGAVAVDLIHKKEHVARELVEFYLTHYQAKGAPLALLWPFRTDFYRNMGFGSGGTLSQYKVRPTDLPAKGHRERVRFLTSADLPALVECYNTKAQKTTGMVIEPEIAWKLQFEAQPPTRYVGYFEQGKLLGYLVYGFEPGTSGSFLSNKLRVPDMVYLTSDALLGLLAFLHSQKDQFERIVINSYDPSFHYLLTDPRDGSDAMVDFVFQQSHTNGIGIMYRVIDAPKLFSLGGSPTYGEGTLTIHFRITDTLLHREPIDCTVRFDDRHAEMVNGSRDSIVVDLDMAEFSSLVMGAVPFSRLCLFGLATCSDMSAVEAISRLFWLDQLPYCITQF